MFGIVAFVLAIIAAICSWLGNDHATAFLYAAVAFIALEMVFPQRGLHGPVARV
jgi:hypothetical protein